MMTSNGNIFRVTGPLWGEFTGREWREALVFSFICTWTNYWANSQDASDLRRHRAHADVTVMQMIMVDEIARILAVLGTLIGFLHAVQIIFLHSAQHRV